MHHCMSSLVLRTVGGSSLLRHPVKAGMVLPPRYLFAGIAMGVEQGLVYAVTEASHAMRAEVHTTWTHIVTVRN